MSAISLKGRLSKFPKAWLALIVALAVGLLAALGARSFIGDRIEQIEARANRGMVEVVVAKTGLRKGDVLSADNLAVRPVPKDFVHTAAVRPEEFEHLAGERLGYDVGAGESILWTFLEAKKVPTFSVRVADGRRAVTVPVDEINSISGLLEPGDIIDLLVSLEHQNKKLAVPVLQGVAVMATGQRSVDDPKTGESRQYETVTLDTTPEEARRLILARDMGRITALLRNPTDSKSAALGADFSSVFNKPAVGTPKRGGAAPVKRRIPVMYGGSPSASAEAFNLPQPQGGAARPAAEPVAAEAGE